jgi:hypothetical protein
MRASCRSPPTGNGPDRRAARLDGMELEAYELVLLWRPADAPDYDEDTLDRLQAEHIAYLSGLRERGLVVANGPVLGQPDPALRGLTFFRTGSPAQTRRLAEDDPLVHAGRLRVDVMTFWCQPGALRDRGHPVTVDD